MDIKKLILGQEVRPGKIILPDGQEVVLNAGQKASPEIQAEVVGIPELADELEVSPKYLRARIRKLGLKKAGPKWAWPPGHPELDQIKSLFKK